jgi:hypothetical protein
MTDCLVTEREHDLLSPSFLFVCQINPHFSDAETGREKNICVEKMLGVPMGFSYCYYFDQLKGSKNKTFSKSVAENNTHTSVSSTGDEHKRNLLNNGHCFLRATVIIGVNIQNISQRFPTCCSYIKSDFFMLAMPLFQCSK